MLRTECLRSMRLELESKGEQKRRNHVDDEVKWSVCYECMTQWSDNSALAISMNCALYGRSLSITHRKGANTDRL